MKRRWYVLIAVVVSMGITALLTRDQIAASLQNSWPVPEGTLTYRQTPQEGLCLVIKRPCSNGTDDYDIAWGATIMRPLILATVDRLNHPTAPNAPDQFPLPNGYTLYRSGTVIFKGRVCNQGHLHDKYIEVACINEVTSQMLMSIICQNPKLYLYY
jgi:hypothetical protein